MLRTNQRSRPKQSGGHFAIVASKYNGRYVDAMLRGATKELKAAKVESVNVVRVPGAFEIPVVASKLASSAAPRLAGIICFGVIFRGETTHAQQIADAVSHALANLQIHHKVPLIHGVYLFENLEQARVRCLSRTHNRGLEAARTALEMAKVMKSL
jgi:6,7-dimethyl-8-ribityllumazine synthase